jgi:hypothetical protein
VVLGVDVPKDKSISCSAWGASLLTKVQVEYACINAFISYEMGKLLDANFAFIFM